MSNSPNAVEGVRWKRIGRRWVVALCAMLAINGVLVVMAVCDYGGRPSSGQAIAASAGTGEAVATAEVAVAAAQSDETALESATASTEASAATNDTAATEKPSVAVDEATPIAEPVPMVSEPKPIVTTTEDAVVSLSTNETEEPLDGAIVIVNPPTTGGIVHCLVNDTTVSLLPGECRRLAATGEQRVVFHRGDDLEDIELPVSEGVFAFSVSEMGWELTPASGEARRQLLRACRVVE